MGAATSLLAKARKLTFHYLWKWSCAIIPALGAIAAAVWAAATDAPAGSARVAAIIASVAGFLGVSWTGIRATLGRALRQTESALWEAEVTMAIGKAATILPKSKLEGPEQLSSMKERRKSRAPGEISRPAPLHGRVQILRAGASMSSASYG